MRKSRLAIAGVVIMASLCAYPAAASRDVPPPAVTVATDRHSATIGDRVRYAISVRLSAGDEVLFPSFPDRKVGIFEIKDSGVITKNGWFGRKTVTGWYTIVAYVTGKVSVPAAEISYKRRGAADWQREQVPGVDLTIQSVLPKDRQVDDIRNIKKPLAYFEVNWPAVIASSALFLAFVGLGCYLRYRATRKPVKLPHETALEEIEAIKAFLAQTGDIKEVFVRISDCIRSYIERSFAVKAPEMTTEEFLNSVKVSSALTMDQKDLLKVFLHACDLVKFAKHQPSAAEIDMFITAAQRFVEETRDKDKPPS